jgi:cytochrome c oxidase subunit 3
MVLGVTFLVVKYFEWHQKWVDGLIPGIHWQPDWEAYTHHLHGVVVDPGHVQMFYRLYFIMTGMHALHMIIGVVVGSCYFVAMLKRRYGPNKYLPVEFFGFYWHFVDIVWVFLFPMMYLVSHPAFPGGGH